MIENYECKLQISTGNAEKIEELIARRQNKKLRYREEHNASVVLSWCIL